MPGDFCQREVPSPGGGFFSFLSPKRLAGSFSSPPSRYKYLFLPSSLSSLFFFSSQPKVEPQRESPTLSFCFFFFVFFFSFAYLPHRCVLVVGAFYSLRTKSFNRTSVLKVPLMVLHSFYAGPPVGGECVHHVRTSPHCEKGVGLWGLDT